MRPAATLSLFAAGLALTFGASAAVGRAIGPLDVGGDDHADAGGDAAGGHDSGGHGATSAAPVGQELSGVTIAAGGYRLIPAAASAVADTRTDYRFRIEGPDGHSVVAFEPQHERALHLIVVSRNLVDFHHLHPEMDADGEWTVELPELAAGSYRVYADFQPTGAEAVTLATDLTVPGGVTAVALPAAEEVSDVAGYRVRRSGEATVGSSTLSFDVSRAGEAVTTEPYLGAAGHLVVIRVGDLAYLHVHPLEQHDGSSAVRFAADFPTAGTYRLFLDFAHDGEVHTASFTVDVDRREAAAGAGEHS